MTKMMHEKEVKNMSSVSVLEKKRKDRCDNIEKAREYGRKIYWKHRDEIIKKNRERRSFGTCDILKKHHDDMKDDPESLSTEFIQKMIGVDCDENDA